MTPILTRPSVSVCLAFYNGEEFIAEQVESILANEVDEVIISNDDCNRPHPDILLTLQLSHPRIKLIWGPGKGVSRNFEKLLYETCGEIIYLSDQDDIWFPDKVETINSCFAADSSLDLIISNCKVSDSNGGIIEESLFERRRPSLNLLGMLSKGPLGCCMAIRRTSLDYILPLPFFAQDFSMHDWWIACLCSSFGRVRLIEKPLLVYRRHENTHTDISPKISGKVSLSIFSKMIYWRVMMFFAIIIRILRFRLFFRHFQSRALQDK